jgi:hypothetical protein
VPFSPLCATKSPIGDTAAPDKATAKFRAIDARGATPANLLIVIVSPYGTETDYAKFRAPVCVNMVSLVLFSEKAV